MYYTKAVLQKRETFGKRGDPHQLGGDFIIDPHGIIRLARPSQDPTDRPAMPQILTTLKKIGAPYETDACCVTAVGHHAAAAQLFEIRPIHLGDAAVIGRRFGIVEELGGDVDGAFAAA